MEGKQSPKISEGSEAEEQAPLNYADAFSALSFWYHLPYEDIRRMPHSAINQYMEKLEKHQAVYRMMLGEAARVPHLKEDSFDAWSRDIEEKINGGTRKVRIAPPGVLKLMGIGIRK